MLSEHHIHLHDDWDESKIHRKPSGEGGGQFTSGGGGGSGPSLRARAALTRGKKRTEAHRRAQVQTYSGHVSAATEWLRRNGGESGVDRTHLRSDQIATIRELKDKLNSLLVNSGNRTVSETSSSPSAAPVQPAARQRRVRAPVDPSTIEGHLAALNAAFPDGKGPDPDKFNTALENIKRLPKDVVNQLYRQYSRSDRGDFRTRKAAIEAIRERFLERRYQHSRMKIVERYHVG